MYKNYKIILLLVLFTLVFAVPVLAKHSLGDAQTNLGTVAEKAGANEETDLTSIAGKAAQLAFAAVGGGGGTTQTLPPREMCSDNSWEPCSGKEEGYVVTVEEQNYKCVIGDEGKCEGEPVTEGPECSGETPAIHPETGKCVECIVDKDCGEDGEYNENDNVCLDEKITGCQPKVGASLDNFCSLNYEPEGDDGPTFICPGNQLCKLVDGNCIDHPDYDKTLDDVCLSSEGSTACLVGAKEMVCEFVE